VTLSAEQNSKLENRSLKLMLSRNNLHTHWEYAGKNFTAMCGHKVKKGELVLQFHDYFNGTHFHKSSCEACTKMKQEAPV
jgi:hypothetical protein